MNENEKTQAEQEAYEAEMKALAEKLLSEEIPDNEFYFD